MIRRVSDGSEPAKVFATLIRKGDCLANFKIYGVSNLWRSRRAGYQQRWGGGAVHGRAAAQHPAHDTGLLGTCMD